ncbi:MAG TPA: metal ABC transporter ATP-binding protein [Candidatus Nanopelagicales bacterium]
MSTAGAAEHHAAFEMRGGCVEFDGTHVFNHLDLTIEPGSFVALLGANGSGKTTLVRALLGLQPLSHGSIRIHGVPLERFRDWQRVAFVPQRLPAATGVPISVGELVLSSRISPRTRWRPVRRHDRQAALDALAVVGLAERWGDRIDTLSGGQQRRVMVARALAEGADTLVLDEPTAGVDLANQQRLAGTLGSLREHTVLLVAHGLGAMAGLVTRAIVLDHGRVIHDGPDAPPGWTDVHHHTDGDLPPTMLEG